MKINNFQGELTDISAKKEALLATLRSSEYWREFEYVQVVRSASVFKINSNVFLDTSIQRMFLYIIQIKKFRGDLTDISAKTNPGSYMVGTLPTHKLSAMLSCDQCRTISEITPKIIYFYCQTIYDRIKLSKNNFEILKKNFTACGLGQLSMTSI